MLSKSSPEALLLVTVLMGNGSWMDGFPRCGSPVTLFTLPRESFHPFIFGSSSSLPMNTVAGFFQSVKPRPHICNQSHDRLRRLQTNQKIVCWEESFFWSWKLVTFLFYCSPPPPTTTTTPHQNKTLLLSDNYLIWVTWAAETDGSAGKPSPVIPNSSKMSFYFISMTTSRRQQINWRLLVFTLHWGGGLCYCFSNALKCQKLHHLMSRLWSQCWTMNEKKADSY